MPEGQGDLDDDEAKEAAQSRADCAKAAGCRRDAQFWEELAAVLQALEVSESTYSRWRAQYGGMKAEEAVRNGTAASVVDLNPIGFSNSHAYAVASNVQVGAGWGPATGNKDHALLWRGSGASVLGLHLLLTGLPVTVVNSVARSIDSSGTIVGEGYDGDGQDYPIAWTPGPDPGDYNQDLVVDASDYII